MLFGMVISLMVPVIAIRVFRSPVLRTRSYVLRMSAHFPQCPSTDILETFPHDFGLAP